MRLILLLLLRRDWSSAARRPECTWRSACWRSFAVRPSWPSAESFTLGIAGTATLPCTRARRKLSGERCTGNRRALLFSGGSGGRPGPRIELRKKEAVHRSGIVEEIAGHRLRFRHLTFQELLAALQLAWLGDGDPVGSWWPRDPKFGAAALASAALQELAKWAYARIVMRVSACPSWRAKPSNVPPAIK
jgi:hypothetical protein